MDDNFKAMTIEQEIRSNAKKLDSKICNSRFLNDLREPTKCSEFAQAFRNYGAFLTTTAFFIAVTGFLFSINKSSIMTKEPVIDGFISLTHRIMEFSSLIILFFLISVLLRILIMEANNKENYYFNLFGLLLLVFALAFLGYILLTNMNLIVQLMFFVIGLVGLILFLWFESIYKKKIITRIKNKFIQKAAKVGSGIVLLMLLWPLLTYTDSLPAFQTMGTITNMGIVFFFLMIAIGLFIGSLDLVFSIIPRMLSK